MKAKDVMTTPVITVSAETEVREIAQLLLEKRISGVPVVDAGQNLLGIVSEGDLIRHVGTGAEDEGRGSWWLAVFASPGEQAQSYVKHHGRFAREVMTRKVHAVSEEATLPEIARILESRAVKRVPVVRGRKVIGIVSRANLLHGLVAAKPQATRSVADAELRDGLNAEIAKAGIRATFLNIVVADGIAQVWGSVESREELHAVQVVVENADNLIAVENHVNVLPSVVRNSMGA